MQRRLSFELCAIEAMERELFDVSVKIVRPKEWILSLSKLKDTPYSEGTFDISVSFGDEYPFKKPSITFLTRIYHPNISDTGGVCLGMLSDEGWSPSHTIKACITQIYWLLRNPEVQNPSVPEIADVYISNLDKFNDNAKKWVVLYAKK